MGLKKEKLKLRHIKEQDYWNYHSVMVWFLYEISKHFNFLIFRHIFDENT